MRARLLALLTLIGIAYTFYSIFRSRSNLSAWPESETAFAEDFKELQHVKKSLLITDDDAASVLGLREEAYHATVIGRFAAAYSRAANLSLWQELNAVLSRRYPWWLRNASAYIPWRAPKLQIEGGLTSTGIVVCVDRGNFMFAAHLIRTLRNVHQSTLPIEIAFTGDGDLPKAYQKAFTDLAEDIFLNDLLSHFKDDMVGLSGAGSQAKAKPFAIIASRFSNVILVDADSVFLQSPDNLLQRSPQFRNTGTLFYHGRAFKDHGISRKVWISEVLLANKKSSAHLQQSLFWKENLSQEMESGVIAINKSVPQLVLAMLFAARMNSRGIRETIYGNMLSNKETYWIAAEMTGSPYAFQPEYAGSIGQPVGSLHDRKQCSAHMAHADETGRKPFWFNGGLVKNKALQHELTSSSLTTFSHFMPGGTSMDDQPRWIHSGDDVWCAEGRPSIPLHSHGLDRTVSLMLEEAAAVETELKELI